MTAVRDEIITNIGNMLGQIANETAEKWDYFGYVFEMTDGISAGGQTYLYKNKEKVSVNLRPVREVLWENFKRLRELTRSDKDEYWIKCLAVIKFEGRDFQMRFEFDNPKRWKIGPANAGDAYELIIGDIFPEAIER